MRQIIAGVLLVVMTSAASAVELGDPDRGLAYARDYCTECHAVERGDYESPFFGTPPFSEIANVPAMSELALISFFQTPHPTMPNFIIPSDTIRDLIAYIRSLRN
ncbi:MAG: cytochrome c [Hyphomicrobiales bacterium]|nr:cytochrome c [Hyphomicrobiales bacterium]